MFVIVQDQQEDGPSFYWYGGEAWGFHIGKAAAFESDEYALRTVDLIRKATGEAFPAAEVVEIF
jgi:hypothetical protein